MQILLAVIAATLLVFSTSTLAQPCDQRVFHDDCLANASCMLFAGSCATTCDATTLPSPSTSCSSPECTVISSADNTCRPSCGSAVSSGASSSDAALCSGTPGCIAYRASPSATAGSPFACVNLCSGDSPYFAFDTKAQCEANTGRCFFVEQLSQCMTKCSLATTFTSCSAIDPAGNCEWDFASKQCVVGCSGVAGSKALCEDTALTNGRCMWIEPEQQVGGCVPKCSRATTQIDCDLLSSSCMFTTDSSTGNGKCQLQCAMLPPSKCEAAAGTFSACRKSDSGLCQLFECSSIKSKQFCNTNCQWVAGSCMRACQIYTNMKNAGVSSCNVFRGKNQLCAMDESVSPATCKATDCDQIMGTGARDVCISQAPRCTWTVVSGTAVCRKSCSALNTFTLCGTASYCRWAVPSLPGPPQDKQCIAACDKLSSSATCGAEFMSGCEWRYDSTQQITRCFSSPCSVHATSASACSTNFCIFANFTALTNAPVCQRDCSMFTYTGSSTQAQQINEDEAILDGNGCVAAGCSWDPQSCACSLPPTLRPADQCNCPGCAVDVRFPGVCSVTPDWQPSFACFKTTLAPTTTQAPGSGNGNGNGNGGNNTGNSTGNSTTGGATADSGASIVGPVVGGFAGALLLIIGVYVYIKMREDSRAEKELQASDLETAPGATVNRQFQGEQMKVEYTSYQEADAGAL